MDVVDAVTAVSEVLMLSGVELDCPDCAGPALFVPALPGEWCCTVCDAAVVLLDVAVGEPGHRAA